MTLCFWGRQISWIWCTASTAWYKTLYSMRQLSPRPGDHRRGWNCVTREAWGVDYWVNALQRAEFGELLTHFQWPTYASNWGIPTTIKPRSPVRLGGGIEMIPRQLTCHPGVTSMCTLAAWETCETNISHIYWRSSNWWISWLVFNSASATAT